MDRKYFTAANTENCSDAELAQMNENVEVVLHGWGSTPESWHYEDDVKNACALVHNAFPDAPDLE